jgi:hypothetical protein
VGGSCKSRAFYYVDEAAQKSIAGLPEWYDQLGSFNREHLLKQLNGVLEPFIVEQRVEVLPLSELIERSKVGCPHLLHIDTEGYDYEVLKTLDFAKHSPLVIFLEHKHLRTEERSALLQLLRAYRYSIHDCGGDYLAIRRDVSARVRWKARAAQTWSVLVGDGPPVHRCAGRSRPQATN